MTIKAVTRYQSEDGKLFDNIKAAQAYNAQQKAMHVFMNAIHSAAPGHQLGLLHINIVNSPVHTKALRDACNKILDYHRNYGKLQKKLIND